MVEIRHLIYFEAVARHQHVSRAAAELLVAQPALSRTIRELERDLGGVRLLEKAGRNVRLTDAGRALHERALAILAEVEAARAEMRGRAGAERGRVGIGTPPTVGVRLLPQVLAEFHQLHPHVELHVRENSSRELVRLLDEGEIDMAIATLPAPRRDMVADSLFEEELVLVVAEGHPLAARGAVDFAELADEPFLLYPPGYEMREATLAACRRAGFSPRVVLDGGEIDMLLRLAEVGLGLALMPPLALGGGEPLARLRVRDQRLRREMGVLHRRDRALTPVAAVMRSFLVSRLSRA
jgi:DNA-binding transcriptional LysR family regulator